MSQDEKYYTVQQIASLLQVHWQSVLNYIKRGELEAIQLGRGYRISEKALQDFIGNRSTRRKK
jgi:excisionase family DNA binding protein